MPSAIQISRLEGASLGVIGEAGEAAGRPIDR
jgi:hypothetical protein